MTIVKTKIGNLVIEGFDSDYIFQTIEKTQNFYEYEILNIWNKYISESKIIFDIGANLGNHSLYWAIKIKPKIIYSFEPYLPTFERLKNNVKNNDINNVMIINKGVGENNGFASVKSFDETNFGSTTLQYENDPSADGIEIVDIDNFVKENNIESVDFIKVDVEGFEVSVILGMINVLNTVKPDLWIEVGVNTFQEIFDILLPLGYILVDVQGSNVLLLNKSRHNVLHKIDDNKILEKMFYYLGRTNAYYKNYLTAKQWVDDKNKLLKINQDEYNYLKDKYNMHLESYINLKDEYNTSLENYKIEKKQYEEEKSSHADDLLEYYTELDKEEKLIKELKMNIQRLETQNSYLKHENSEYRRKLSKITDTYIGKVAIKIYRTLKRIKAKLK